MVSASSAGVDPGRTLSEGRSVAILGASGLVGSHLVDLLTRDPRVSRVRAVVRKPLVYQSAKLETAVLGLDDLDRAPHLLLADAVICALGTTIRTAGSQEAFRRVDHGYVIAAARLARAAGTPHFLVVSALGASAASRVFYTRVKGEMERDLRAIGFERLTIVRPSLLLGRRSELRPGEQLFKIVGKLVPGNARPIEARDVARVLVDRIFDAPEGTEVIESGMMRSLARSLK